MEAIVLAAGRGTRMRGLCDRLPKPMLPLANRPALERTVESLARAGVERAYLVIGHLAERVREHFGAAPPPIPVEYVIQQEAKGTGHAALLGRGRMKEVPFMLVFGDILTSGRNYARVAADFQAGTTDAVLATRHVEDPWRGAAVYVNGEGFVSRIVEKPPKGQSTTQFDNAGLFCFSPRIWDILEEVKISPRGEYELTDAIQAMLADRGRIRARELEGYWLNLTGPEELLAGNCRVLEEDTGEGGAPRTIHPTASAEGALLGESVSLGPECRVAEGAEIQNAILLPRVRVGKGAVVRWAILGEGVEIAEGEKVEGTPEEVAVRPG